MTINFRQKKVLITGGSGMVGRNFIENELSKNYKLIAPTKKNSNNWWLRHGGKKFY